MIIRFWIFAEFCPDGEVEVLTVLIALAQC